MKDRQILALSPKLAHECQRVDRLPVRPWDAPLDLTVTEDRVYRRGALDR